MGVAVRAVEWRPTFGEPVSAADAGSLVEPISFSIQPGERVLLRGPSGAGKSTLLVALAGVGEAEFDGELTLDGCAPHEQRTRTGLVLQDPFAQAVMSRVGDDIAFGLENLVVPAGEMPARIAEALGAVGLASSDSAADWLNRPTDQLSGGERQRLALAGVLAMRPSLLLLDEPTASLDPQGARLVRDAVARAVADFNLTLIVVDHTPGFWADVVDREIVMGNPRRNVDSGSGAAHRGKPGSPVAPAAPLLAARSLAVGYPGGRVVQNNLNFEVARGSILAITGPNGSGKSALALTLGGLIPAVAGELDTAGALDIAGAVGCVFQAPEHQFVGHTVRADIAAGVRKLPDAATQVDAALREFQLENLADRNPFALSGGEKRRLSIADAVVMRPKILILDEPTTGLDDNAWRDLVVSLTRLRDDGHAIVIVTHDERFVEATADCRLELT